MSEFDDTRVHNITFSGVGSPLAIPCSNLTILFDLETKLKLKKIAVNAINFKKLLLFTPNTKIFLLQTYEVD